MPNGSKWNAMYVNCVFVWLFVCLFVCPSIRLSVCPSECCLSVCLWLVACRLVRMLFVCLYAACIICIKRALWMYLTCALITPRKLPHVMFQTVAQTSPVTSWYVFSLLNQFCSDLLVQDPFVRRGDGKIWGSTGDKLTDTWAESHFWHLLTLWLFGIHNVHVLSEDGVKLTTLRPFHHFSISVWWTALVWAPNSHDPQSQDGLGRCGSMVGHGWTSITIKTPFWPHVDWNLPNLRFTNFNFMQSSLHLRMVS